MHVDIVRFQQTKSQYIFLFTYGKLCLNLILILVIPGEMHCSIVIFPKTKLRINYYIMWVFVSMLERALDLEYTFTTTVTLDQPIRSSPKMWITWIHMKSCSCAAEFIVAFTYLLAQSIHSVQHLHLRFPIEELAHEKD